MKKIFRNKIIVITATFLIIIAGIFLLFLFQKQQQETASCKKLCEFRESKKVWDIEFYEENKFYISTRSFPTQEQCIDYCFLLEEENFILPERSIEEIQKDTERAIERAIEF